MATVGIGERPSQFAWAARSEGTCAEAVGRETWRAWTTFGNEDRKKRDWRQVARVFRLRSATGPIDGSPRQERRECRNRPPRRAKWRWPPSGWCSPSVCVSRACPPRRTSFRVCRRKCTLRSIAARQRDRERLGINRRIGEKIAPAPRLRTDWLAEKEQMEAMRERFRQRLGESHRRLGCTRQRCTAFTCFGRAKFASLHSEMKATRLADKVKTCHDLRTVAA